MSKVLSAKTKRKSSVALKRVTASKVVGRRVHSRLVSSNGHTVRKKRSPNSDYSQAEARWTNELAVATATDLSRMLSK